MNTKAGTSFGPVLMLAIGVIAAMLALGILSAPKAHATVEYTKATQVMPDATGSTASSTALSASARVVAAPCDVSVVFADVYTADEVERVFLFTNPTAEGEFGVWTFNDPREAFQVFNTYTTVTSGDIAWVIFRATSTFQGKRYFTGINQIRLTC